MERVDQSCKLQAQVRFPGLTEKSENEYGYHADVLRIKNNDSEICSYFNNVTSWCRTYGDAVLYRTEAEYYDYDQAFAALIPDAAVKSFYFELDHYDGSYSTPAVLNVFANGKLVSASYYGADFDHDTFDFHSDGDTPFSADVDCDSSCECEIFVRYPLE